MHRKIAMGINGIPSLALEADSLKSCGAPTAQQLNEQRGAPNVVSKTKRWDPNAGIAAAMEHSRNRAEFERAINEQLDTVTRLAIRLTGDSDRAEELVQETMLRAAGSWQSFRQQASFKTWLYRILINVFRDGLRRKTKLKFEELPAENCLDETASASAITEAGELAEIVARSIQALPPRQREVLVLTTYESLTSQQVAEALEITVANVHSNLSIARRTLKRQIGRYWETP